MDKRKILVIDDEPAFTNMLRLNLERTGVYTVREQNRARGAVAAAREFRPDLILLDVIMPELDGGTVAALMGRDPELSHIPIVLLTAAVSSRESGAEGLESGGYLFLSKPIALQRLIHCIEANLGGHAPAPTRRGPIANAG